MRIIPYELFSYTPDMILTALRKELLMYDHCLNKKNYKYGNATIFRFGTQLL